VASSVTMMQNVMQCKQQESISTTGLALHLITWTHVGIHFDIT